MRIRSIVVALAAIAAGSLVLRLGLVRMAAQRDPVQAAALWPDHPDFIFSAGLDQVGQAAVEGRPIDRNQIAHMLAATGSAPLAPEPFLVRGVEAQLAGDEDLAAKAFAAARQRDPRSVPARYFLAEHFLRTNQVRLGLNEIAALVRLVPNSAEKVAPYLASFAKMPGSLASVKSVLRGRPDLQLVLLRKLSADAANADTVMALWDGRRDADAGGWQQQLVDKLVEAGQVAKAHAVWARFAGRPVTENLLNAPFDGRGTPPPFGWRLASGAEGIAETAGEGQLHLLHYGRSDMVLADRLLLLPPGNYRMSMRVNGTSAALRRMGWSLRCLPSRSALTSFDLSIQANNMAVRPFTVPAGCTAQQLDLTAFAPEFPEQADVTISAFTIEPGSGR